MTWRHFFGKNLRDAADTLRDKPLSAIAAMAVDLGDPRISSEFPLDRRCPHGLAFRNCHLPAGAWNGPLSECACCYGTFGYLDSASFSAGRTTSRTWMPRHLCGACGGKYVDYDSGLPRTERDA